MKRTWQIPAKVLAGLIGVAVYATPQAYTISARPGVVNYIEGTAYLDGKQISDTSSGRTFLVENATLRTEHGKAEILLTPGVFMRLGPDSEVRMISPTLTNTKLELMKGSAMVEVGELVKENEIEILDHGATTKIEKVGLYRFTADGQPTAAVLDGKAEVNLADRKVEIGKGRDVTLSAGLKQEHFDAKDNQDDLYTWSQTRDQYASAASYSAAKTVGLDNWSSGGWGYGFSGFNSWGGPGWAFNPAFGSYAWLPGDGAFFSPFGYGFFAPGYVAYAPVTYAAFGGRSGIAVPVNPGHLPTAVGSRPTLYTASGTPFQPGALGHHANWAAAHGGANGHVAGNSFVANGGGIGATSSTGAVHANAMRSGGGGWAGHGAGGGGGGGWAGHSAGGGSGGGWAGHSAGGGSGSGSGGGGGGGMHSSGGGGSGGGGGGGGGGGRAGR